MARSFGKRARSMKLQRNPIHDLDWIGFLAQFPDEHVNQLVKLWYIGYDSYVEIPKEKPDAVDEFLKLIGDKDE